MNGHRTCIICLPRTGSQLCERLSAEIKASTCLGEYFENWNRSKYVVDTNKIHLRDFASITSNFKIAEDFDTRLELLKKADLNQSLTLRIFLMDQYDKEVLSKIVLELKNIGFEFLSLQRNIKEQILSYMIVYSYRVSKNTNVFSINKSISEPVTINLSGLNDVVNHINISSINWGNNLSKILNGIDYQKIKYESMYSDMETIYNRKFKYSGEKSIKSDPFDLILNKEEVMEFLLKI